MRAFFLETIQKDFVWGLRVLPCKHFDFLLVIILKFTDDKLILSPCLVVSGQDASGPWDGCMRSRWLRSISPIQILVWLLRNAGF